MKTLKLFLIPTIALVTIASCRSKKIPLAKQTGAIEITVPFSGKDYQSDEDFFRAKQSGKSPDLAAAKKIALQNAKSELASNIQSVIKKVTDQYTNQHTVGKDQDFENKFEELSREVTDQSIANVSIKDEKIFQETDGGYTYWIAVEADKKTVFQQLDNKISNDAKLKVDYDKAKFQQTFDDEMKKFADSQQGQ
jgi:hypothetical protein